MKFTDQRGRVKEILSQLEMHQERLVITIIIIIIIVIIIIIIEIKQLK